MGVEQIRRSISRLERDRRDIWSYIESMSKELAALKNRTKILEESKK